MAYIISRPRVQQSNTRLQEAKIKAAEAEARAKIEAEAKAHAEWEAEQAKSKAEAEARWREDDTRRSLSQAQRLAAEVERELEDAKALVDAKRRAVVSARTTVDERSEAWAEAKADIDGHDKKELLYVSGNGLYDSLERAKELVDGKMVYKCHSLEQAKYALRKNGHETFEYKTGKDLSYVNKKGETIYEVYTDGSCQHNGRPKALGGVGVYFGRDNRFNVSEPLEGSPQSNQRAELTAVLKAYRIIASEGKGRKYDICTDSNYAIDCLTSWASKWRKNGWTNSSGNAVKNQDLLIDLMNLKDKHPEVVLKKVKAHSNSTGNEQADKLARAGVTSSGAKKTYCSCSTCVRSPYLLSKNYETCASL